MLSTLLARPMLAAALVLVAVSAAPAQPPRGYRVESYGTFDRFPFPPAAGEHREYWYGPPWVTLRDPFGGEASMPLRPKVLYYDTPFATPGGMYRPRYIAVIPDDRTRAAPRWSPPRCRGAPGRFLRLSPTWLERAGGASGEWGQLDSIFEAL